MKKFYKDYGIMIAINRSTRAAIDLASIMVGILVIGIIGGIIAAMVFSVIPWAQDNAAKSSLDAAITAEQVTFTWSSENGKGEYKDTVGLEEQKLLPEDSGLDIYTDVDKTCFVAVATSATKKKFFVTNKQQKAQLLAANTLNGCVDPDIIWNDDDDDTNNPPVLADALPPISATLMGGGGDPNTDYPNVTGFYFQGGGPVAGGNPEDMFPVLAKSGFTPGEYPITNVRAWIGSQQVSVHPGTRMAATVTPGGFSIQLAEYNQPDFWVGDGLNKTMRAFGANGTISFDLDGVAGNSIKWTNMTSGFTTYKDGEKDRVWKPTVEFPRVNSAWAYGDSGAFSATTWAEVAGGVSRSNLPSLPSLSTINENGETSITPESGFVTLKDGTVLTSPMDNFDDIELIVVADNGKIRNMHLSMRGLGWTGTEAGLLDQLDGATVTFVENGTTNRLTLTEASTGWLYS